MRVLVAAAQFSSDISGLQRHAFNLLRCLLKRAEVTEIHLVIAPWQRALVEQIEDARASKVRVYVAAMDKGIVSRNRWYYRDLPQLAAQVRAEIVHLTYPVPVNAAAIGCPVVVTLHDLYPYEIPANFGWVKGVFNRAVLQQCLRGADAIACVSEATRARLRQYAGLEAWNKSCRIYNCVEAESVATEASPVEAVAKDPFLLCVAQHRKNKNIPLLIRAFAQLRLQGVVSSRFRLLVVGIDGPETEAIHRLVARLQLEERVVFLRGIPEAALQWCYAHCELLVAPSKTEGFGLPVAEALLAGCRVVCSDIPAFREIDEQHCRFVMLGKHAEQELAQAIAMGLRDAPFAPVTLPQFSSVTLGRQYVELYEQLLGAAETEGAA